MIYDYKNEFKKRLNIIVSISYDTVIIIFVLFCFYLINYVAKVLGFENETVSSLIHGIIHPVLLLSIFSISIINIFHEHMPSKDSKTRFEIIHETDAND